MAPEFTIGFVRPSGLRSMPSSELNARPVAFTPIFWRAASTPDGLTDQGEEERLRDAHDRELVIRVTDRIDVAAGADHADAEQLGRHGRQRRIHLRILAPPRSDWKRWWASATSAWTSSAGGKWPVDTYGWETFSCDIR